jgi:hypothetical protein
MEVGTARQWITCLHGWTDPGMQCPYNFILCHFTADAFCLPSAMVIDNKVRGEWLGGIDGGRGEKRAYERRGGPNWPNKEVYYASGRLCNIKVYRTGRHGGVTSIKWT